MRPTMPELYFGFTKLIGTDATGARAVLNDCLEVAGYHVVDIHLATLLEAMPDIGPVIRAQDGSDEYARLHAYMDAGGLLRATIGSSAMAKVALREVHRQRTDAYEVARGRNCRGVAFVLRTLKHEAEVATLRAVLGTRFFLISLFSRQDERTAKLRTKLSQHGAGRHPGSGITDGLIHDLLAREQEHESAHQGLLAAFANQRYGLNVDEAFHDGDLFVDADHSEQAQHAIERFVWLIFGYPYSTSSEDECALAHAFAAQRESAAVARQVGASVTVEGVVVGTGRNDVPRAGGGQLRLPSVLGPNEVVCAEPETSYQERSVVYRDAIRRLFASTEWRQLAPRYDLHGFEDLTPSLVEELLDAIVAFESVRKSRVFDLLEFNPTLHAEMSALTNCARSGVIVSGGTLYTTTFPCHECTRHIIASGIGRVVYLEPYRLSRAELLFPTQVGMGSKGYTGETDDRVVFDPFIGVAPRRQADLLSPVFRDVSREAIRGWALDGTRQLRGSIEPDLPVELSEARREHAVREQELVVSMFEDQLGAASAGDGGTPSQ